MMRSESGALDTEHDISPRHGREIGSTGAGKAGRVFPGKAVIGALFASLEEKGVRYCHWKSNIRLEETLAGVEDIDLLVDRRHAGLFRAALLENGFKLAPSRSGIGHPGVFHALALDEASGELVHLHAYYQIVTGDSLVKTYRLPIENVLLERTRRMHGVKVPEVEAELVLFALRIALKHVSPIELLMVNRHYGKVLHELAWLRGAANARNAEALCTAAMPGIDPTLLNQLLEAIGNEGAILRRVILGRRVAHRLADWRRLSPALAAASRLWRLLSLTLGRLRRRKGLMPEAGGMIVALVGPKATGKSTLASELSARLGRHLDTHRIHAGKPPATALTLLPRLLLPVARALFRNERTQEYETQERRQLKQYSLLYILRMTMLGYERYRLLRRALRIATAGGVVISDRYPSPSIGAIDSSCFDELALAKCNSPLKRWLMKKERAYYKAMPKPDLVIRLMAPMDTAIRRDAQRSKPGGPDAEAVQRRWQLESHAVVFGAPVIPCDTSRPLEDTVRATVAAIWAVL